MNNEDTLIVHNERLTTNNNNLDEILNMVNELPDASTDDETGGTTSEIYSTEETNTGRTWIDGKPIYRKVFTTTLPTITNNYVGYTSVYIDISSTNCEQVISWDGTISQAGGTAFWNLDWYNSAVSASSITNIDMVNKQIRVRENSDWLSEGTVIIILEYTKVDE